MKLLCSARQQFIRYIIFWCLNSRKIFIHMNKQWDWQLISKFQHVKLNQVWKSEIFNIQIKQSINQKNHQQNASYQIITHKLKMILHLVKSKIYSKCHQLQFKNISDSSSQICWNDLTQNSLHSSHDLNQILFWINSTVYLQAHLMIWIVNSALNLHWSSNLVWLSPVNLMIQLIKKMMNFTIIIKTIYLNLMWTSR